MSVTVFIPAYNEQAGIKLAVEAVLDAYGGDVEVIVVDDGSDDDTSKVINEKFQKLDNVRLVRYPSGPTRRENLARSFALSESDVICFMDADIPTCARYLPEFSKKTDEFDIVIGSRLIEGSDVKRSLSRNFFSRFASTASRILFGSSLHDHQCGLKAFRADILKELTREAGFDLMGWRGFGWDTEILVRAQRKGFKIKETAIIWEEGRKTSVRFFRDWKVIPYMVSLRFRL